MTVQPFTGDRITRSAEGKPYERRLTPATVYTLLADDGQALYVGCSGQPARITDHGRKPWWTDVATINLEHFEERRDALDRERDLIERLLPLHNVAGIPKDVLAERAAA